MRNIIFRGRSISHHGKKEEWVYGFYSNYKGVNGRTHYISSDNGNSAAVREETVGQYTGMTDKNGKGIFEGDIISYDYIRYVEPQKTEGRVFYKNGSFLVNVYVGAVISMPLGYLFGDDVKVNTIEIVGNIHDMPDFQEEWK